MAIRNDASLRGKIRAIAKREGLRPQEVLQMFLFEHLLLRLEKTSYVDKFILNGVLLISSMIGASLRTTMDMDTTVVGMPLPRSVAGRSPRCLTMPGCARRRVLLSEGPHAQLGREFRAPNRAEGYRDGI